MTGRASCSNPLAMAPASCRARTTTRTPSSDRPRRRRPTHAGPANGSIPANTGGYGCPMAGNMSTKVPMAPIRPMNTCIRREQAGRGLPRPGSGAGAPILTLEPGGRLISAGIEACTILVMAGGITAADTRGAAGDIPGAAWDIRGAAAATLGAAADTPGAAADTPGVAAAEFGRRARSAAERSAAESPGPPVKLAPRAVAGPTAGHRAAAARPPEAGTQVEALTAAEVMGAGKAKALPLKARPSPPAGLSRRLRFPILAR